ncbi:hypothetical protein EV122DRAFT_285274 [Schizophyllum commune]
MSYSIDLIVYDDGNAPHAPYITDEGLQRVREVLDRELLVVCPVGGTCTLSHSRRDRDKGRFGLYLLCAVLLAGFNVVFVAGIAWLIGLEVKIEWRGSYNYVPRLENVAPAVQNVIAAFRYP